MLSEVYSEPRGSELAAAYTGGLALFVDDAGDFDEDGGTLDVEGNRAEYTGIIWGETDADPDQITLAAAMPAAAVDDFVAPIINGQPAVDYFAVVDMGAGDSVTVGLTFFQASQLGPGKYGDIPVQISDDGDSLEDLPGTATIQGRFLYEDRDTGTAPIDGTTATVALRWNYPGAIQEDTITVYKNGLRLEPTQWTYDPNSYTVSIPHVFGTLHTKTADRFGAAYFYDQQNITFTGTDQPEPPGPTPTLVNYSATRFNFWDMPASPVVGNLMVAVAFVPNTATVTANGWTPVADSMPVTHAANSGTYTYRMVALYKTYDGTPTLPTLAGNAGLASLHYVVQVNNASAITAAYTITPDATTANSPTGTPPSVRAWGAISNLGVLSVATENEVLTPPADDVDMAVAFSTQAGPVAATCTSSAGWVGGNFALS